MPRKPKLQIFPRRRREPDPAPSVPSAPTTGRPLLDAMLKWLIAAGGPVLLSLLEELLRKSLPSLPQSVRDADDGK